MKSLSLRISDPRQYVKAMSGFFDDGLTVKEVDVLAVLMVHSEDGRITTDARKRVMEDLQLKPQNLYNTITNLKHKKAILGDDLHKIFMSDQLRIENAVPREDS